MHSSKRNALSLRLDTSFSFAKHDKSRRAPNGKHCQRGDAKPATATPATIRPRATWWHQVHRLEVSIITDLQHRAWTTVIWAMAINQYIFNQFNGRIIVNQPIPINYNQMKSMCLTVYCLTPLSFQKLNNTAKK